MGNITILTFVLQALALTKGFRPLRFALSDLRFKVCVLSLVSSSNTKNQIQESSSKFLVSKL